MTIGLDHLPVQYGCRLIFAPVGDAGLCTIVFRRFVGQALLTLRLLGEAPFGDSVRRMDAAFGGIVPLCWYGHVIPRFLPLIRPIFHQSAKKLHQR